MAHLGSGVEYGLHCLLWLVESGSKPASSRDLAELQGVSPSFLAKVFQKLEKAGIVKASEGIRGGYVLSRQPRRISVLEVVDAIEGDKPLFECQEVRGRCALFGDQPPAWSVQGVCAIHSVMLRAEKVMRSELQQITLDELAETVRGKAPSAFFVEVRSWLDSRLNQRSRPRPAGRA